MSQEIYFSSYYFENYIQLKSYLLSFSENSINERNIFTPSILHCICKCGNIEILKILVA